MMETIPNEIFLNVQNELGNDSEKEGHQIFFIFSISNFSIMPSFPKHFFLKSLHHGLISQVSMDTIHFKAGHAETLQQ